jgi:hypothetical protein
VQPTQAPSPASLATRASLAWAVLALLGFPAGAHAVETQGQAQASLGTGYDSNAGHDVDSQAQGDGVVLGRLQLEGALFSQSSVFALSGRYDLGAKKFYSVAAQDLVAQQGSLQGSARVGPLTLGLLAAAKDRRSRLGDRDYSDFSGELFGESRPHKWPLRFEIGAELFQFHPDAQYTFAGPTALLSATAPLAAHHALRATADAAFRAYDAASADLAGNLRRDSSLGGGLSYRYKGRFIGELAYDFLADFSNQVGRSEQRHRFTGSVAVFLPLKVALAASGALQFAHFPDGVALTPVLLLTSDGENTNSLSVSLSRAFAHGIQVELRAAGY